jgi:lipopolysaccharide transport system permease protein
LVTALLFTSTAIMPASSVAPEVRWLFALNPLSFIIDQSREVALWGHMPDWVGLGLYGLCALVFTYAGFAVFLTARRGFADVL